MLNSVELTGSFCGTHIVMIAESWMVWSFTQEWRGGVPSGLSEWSQTVDA